MASGDVLLAGSSVTLGQLMAILDRNDKTYTLGTDPGKLTAAPTENCISTGKGYSSKITRVTLETATGSHSVLFKVAEPQKLQADESDEQLNVKLDMIASAHNREVAFYEFVRENAIENLSLVKYFHGTEMNVSEKKQGIIVMEDLTGRMMGEYQLGRGVGVDAVLNIFKTLSVLQVYSLLHQDTIQKKFAHNMKVLNAIQNYVVYCCKELEKRDLLWFTKEISEICQKNADPSNSKKLLSPDVRFGDIGAVIVHGDLWPNNMIWQENKGNPDLLAICDWQCAHAGNYTADIAAVMAVSMDGEDRRRHEKELLAFYTEQMNMNLAIHDVSTRLDFDKVCASYKNSLNYAILQMIMTVVTNPKDDVPADGEVEGPLTKRLRALVEDMYLL